MKGRMRIEWLGGECSDGYELLTAIAIEIILSLNCNSHSSLSILSSLSISHPFKNIQISTSSKLSYPFLPCMQYLPGFFTLWLLLHHLTQAGPSVVHFPCAWGVIWTGCYLDDLYMNKVEESSEYRVIASDGDHPLQGSGLGPCPFPWVGWRMHKAASSQGFLLASY